MKQMQVLDDQNISLQQILEIYFDHLPPPIIQKRPCAEAEPEQIFKKTQNIKYFYLRDTKAKREDGFLSYNIRKNHSSSIEY